MEGFFNLYDQRAADLDAQLQQVKGEMEETSKEISALQSNMRELNIGRGQKEARWDNKINNSFGFCELVFSKCLKGTALEVKYMSYSFKNTYHSLFKRPNMSA